MKQNRDKILQQLKGKKAGVFVDDSNLYHSYKKYGWHIDFKKLKNLLERYCEVRLFNYYVAIPDKSDADYTNVQRFLTYLKPTATIKTKPLKYIQVAGAVVRKGDVDVEVVLDVVRNIETLDAVIILSGDSDFLELKNYTAKEKKKNIIFWAYEKNMAWELKYCWHLYLDDFREEIELIKHNPRV